MPGASQHSTEPSRTVRTFSRSAKALCEIYMVFYYIYVSKSFRGKKFKIAEAILFNTLLVTLFFIRSDPVLLGSRIRSIIIPGHQFCLQVIILFFYDDFYHQILVTFFSKPIKAKLSSRFFRRDRFRWD